MARNSGRRARHDYLNDPTAAVYGGAGLLPGDGGGSVTGYLLNRAKPHLPPWLAVGATGLAGALGNWRWGDSSAAGVGLTLASVALTGATWWAGKSTSQQRRLHSAITVAAGSAWLTAACLAGPAAGPLDDLFLMGGPVVALSWNVRMVLRRNDDPSGESADKGLMEKIGLARAQLGNPKVEPNRVTAPVALAAGEQTNDDMAKALGNIASALDLPTSAVRYHPDPDSNRRGDLVIVPEDMLADVVEWEGPSNLGGSIAEPLVIGRYDDGAPLLLWLPGDPEQGRNSTHVLTAGMSGSGKGDAALNLLTEVLSRRDVIVWFSDPKAFQDFAPLREGLDWGVEGGTGTEVMVAAVQQAIPARTRWLGEHGYRQWVPAAAQQQTSPEHSCRPDGRPCGCAGMPFLVTWFEEAANTLRNLGDDAFTGIAQEARSAGISLIVSLQRPSYDQMSTSTRASLPSVIALGCDPRDEGFCLPDEVLAAGAHPGAWGNRRPGYCYVVSPGIPEDRYPSPGRTRRFTHRAVPVMELLATWAQRNGATADPVTAGAASAVAGTAYTGRTPTSTAAAAGAGSVPQLHVVHGEGDDMQQHSVHVDPEDTGIDPEADLPEVEQGDDAPIFGQETGRKPSPEEARELFARALAEFEENGQMIVGPKDFMDWCDRHHLSRPWVSARLKEAALDGRLEATNTTGRWRIVPALTAA
ncbi:plasmid transfer protein TraB [Streptomyces daghestanicus]|uniref:Sporulation protein SsgA n=1 Tax=Streptomyces daghestanicus TaxID=66885 RepID=A0ABQ3Q2V0_9ACTN|nr:plasmid transfer protein TraB [Streptomyces daghestanicus]GGU20656.1 sporulation protein SsgA [Streptomyces daghestanicus]GHI31580.1 sporulation protein SsgA [Streptomyces daghestanicus]